MDEEESKNIDKDDSNSSVKDKDVLSETKATSKVEDQLEFVEFQLFLQYLRQYFLYCQVVFEVITSRS